MCFSFLCRKVSRVAPTRSYPTPLFCIKEAYTVNCVLLHTPYFVNSVNEWTAAVYGAETQLSAFDEPVESHSVYGDEPRRGCHLVEPCG